LCGGVVEKKSTDFGFLKKSKNDLEKSVTPCNLYVKSPLILIILPKNMLRDYLFAKGPPMAMIMTMSPFRVGKSP